MPIEVLKTDKEFKDSPDTGRKECICSRCGKRIMSREFALRITDTEKNTEFRYCPACQRKDMGIQHFDDPDDDDDFWDDDPL